jgi:hypothetical protein
MAGLIAILLAFTLHLYNKLIMKSFGPELVFEKVIDGNLIYKRK